MPRDLSCKFGQRTSPSKHVLVSTYCMHYLWLGHFAYFMLPPPCMHWVARQCCRSKTSICSFHLVKQRSSCPSMSAPLRSWSVLAYRLKLTKNSKSLLKIFQVSWLHPWREDAPRRPPMPPESFELEGALHWNVEKSLKHEHELCRRSMGSRVKRFYSVQWKAWPRRKALLNLQKIWNIVLSPYRHMQTRCRRGRHPRPPSCSDKPPPWLACFGGPCSFVSCDVRGCCIAGDTPGPATSRRGTSSPPPDITGA